MELSILQHAKDNKPGRITIDEVVARMRDANWPTGYQPVLLVQGVFEGGVRQDDIVRMSGLAVVRFRQSPPLMQSARDDPHTLLMFTSADILYILYPYELDTGYEIRLQRQFYKKVSLYGSDYYRQQLEQEPEMTGKDGDRRCPLVHDPQVYYNPNAEWFLAWEIKEGCRRQTSRQKSTDGLRERKPNYQERMMTIGEIEDWLGQHIELHRNVITGRQEYRWLTDHAVTGTGAWLNYDDHTLNTLYRMMKRVKDVKRDEIDKMRDEAMNAMKRAITLSYTNVRGAYQRHAERRPHIASFCGTGNNEKFLNDPTGTRRWLVFKVESLESPLRMPFEYEGIYAQAYYLYREGYKYWFDDNEVTDRRNSRFMVANLEQQLVQRYFRKPGDSEPCEFVDVATALQQFPVNVSAKVRKDAVDQAFIDQDFQAVTLNGIPGYYAIIRKPNEVRTLGLQMAYSARGIKPEEKS